MQKLRKLIWNVLHRNTIYDRIEDQVEIVEVIKTVPGEKGSPCVNVTAYGLIYNKFMNECVQVKQISGTFDRVIVNDVKVEGDVFYIKGQYVNYEVNPNGEFKWITTGWIHETNVYMYVGP